MITIDDKDPPVKNQHSPEARAKAGATRRAKKAAADAATAAAEQGRRRVRPDEEYALPSGKTLLWGDFEKVSLDALLMKDGDPQIIKLLRDGNALSTAVAYHHKLPGHRYYRGTPNQQPVNISARGRPRLTGRYNPPRWKATTVRFLPDLPWHCVSLSGRKQNPDTLNLLGRLKERL